MLIVIYDPQLSDVAISDVAALPFAGATIASYKEGKQHEVRVSNAIVINAFRVHVLRGTIAHTDIVFKYKGHSIRANAEGKLEFWPEGFCDTNEKLLLELLDGVKS